MRRARPPLTAAQQLLHLRRNQICQGAGDIRGRRLVWSFDATPTPLSRTYRVRIELTEGDVPSVFVDAPDVVLLATGRKLPHVYSEVPVRLCLYHPERREWSPVDRLDLTVVPWIYLWLYYYEEWLVSDDWKGGGEHPDVDVEGAWRPPRWLARQGARERLLQRWAR